MQSLSLKIRIGICMAFMILLVCGIVSVVAYSEFREAQFNSLDYRLQSDVDTIREILDRGNFDTADTKKEVQDILTSTAGAQRSGYQIWLEKDPQSAVKNTEPMDLVQFLKDKQIGPPPMDTGKSLNIDQEGLQARMIWARYSVPDTVTQSKSVVNIVLAVKSQYAHHEIHEFTRLLLLLGLVVFCLSIAVIAGTLKWGLKPVEILTDRMNSITDKNLDSVSYEFPKMPIELLPFVKAWEEMLKKLAHAMNEQKRFTSDASHELRTPIAIMKSTLQLAQAQQRSPVFYEQMISQALEDLERLNHLIEQMLTLSRLGASQPVWDWETVHMDQLVQEIAEQYTPFLEEKGFRLVYRTSPAVLQGNPAQLRQLVTNLVDNAAQYAPPNSAISLGMKTNDQKVRITVHDEGGGIPPEECPLIFQRFYRIHKARDRHSGGTGLGLAIAREIAVLHGGDISVRSNPREGTVFTITLPLHEER